MSEAFAAAAGGSRGLVNTWASRGRMPVVTQIGDAVVRVWRNLELAAGALAEAGDPSLAFVTMAYLESLAAGPDAVMRGAGSKSVHGESLAAAPGEALLTNPQDL